MNAPSAFASRTRISKTSRRSGTPSTTSAPDSTVDGLRARLGYAFRDPTLLERALAHRSWVAESPGETSNERLEFLGDAVLGLVVADHVFRSYPDLPEGALTKVRASVVSAAALAEVAAELGLGESIRLGKGEDASGGREKPSILANATEAIIGAVYIDGGWPAASDLVLELVGDRIVDAAAGPGGQDYKTRLQELSARRFDEVPEYRVVDDGPEHAKRFYASVRVGDRVFGGGEGRSKKQAEASVALLAWEALRNA